MIDGKGIGACLSRHRQREFLRFLKLIDQETPADLDLHLVIDNYATTRPWRRSAGGEILEKVARAKQAIEPQR